MDNGTENVCLEPSKQLPINAIKSQQTVHQEDDESLWKYSLNILPTPASACAYFSVRTLSRTFPTLAKQKRPGASLGTGPTPVHLGNRDDPEFRRRVQFASFNPAWITIPPKKRASRHLDRDASSTSPVRWHARGFPPSFDSYVGHVGSLIFNRDKDIIYKEVLFRGVPFDRYLKPDTDGNLSAFWTLDTFGKRGANVAQTTTALLFLADEN